MYLRYKLIRSPTYTLISQLPSSLQIFTPQFPSYLTHSTCPAYVILTHLITYTSHLSYIGIKLLEHFTGTVIHTDITFKL